MFLNLASRGRSVKNLNGYELDRRLRTVGWNLFHLAQMKAHAFGFNREKSVRRAVKRVLATVPSDNFNALEISQVAVERFLGLSYVRVSADMQQLQQSLFLLDDKRLAERNQARLVYSRAERVG